jgi:hypothetical protein
MPRPNRPAQAFQRLLQAVHPRAERDFGAFYSSVLGGIVSEPGLMVLHADDHMAHAGHGVYDVVAICGGALYQLDEHVARLARGAEAAGVPLPMSAPAIKRVLLDTAAASLKLNGAGARARGPARRAAPRLCRACGRPGPAPARAGPAAPTPIAGAPRAPRGRGLCTARLSHPVNTACPPLFPPRNRAGTPRLQGTSSSG